MKLYLSSYQMSYATMFGSGIGPIQESDEMGVSSLDVSPKITNLDAKAGENAMEINRKNSRG